MGAEPRRKMPANWGAWPQVKRDEGKPLQIEPSRCRVRHMKAPDSRLETLAIWLGIAYCVAVIIWMVKL